MALAGSLRKTATKLMSKFGGDVTLRTVTPGIYNPTTGTASEVTADASIKGVLQDVSAREVNDLIQAGDRRLTIAAADVNAAPATADRVIISGVTYQVVRIATIEQDNQPITYELILRA
mgnify:FL=1